MRFSTGTTAFGTRLLGAVALVATLAASALTASAQPAPLTDGWAAGPGAAGNNTYVGFIDQPSGGSTVGTGALAVTGWVVDTTAAGWAGIDNVQIYNGLMGQGGSMVAQANFAQNRPDVGNFFNYGYWANSGFNAVIGAGALPQGAVTLNVYAHTPNKGWWYKSVSFTVSSSGASTGGTSGSGSNAIRVDIFTPAAGACVSTQTASYLITGDAKDPTAPQGNPGVSSVDVWMDGGPGSQYGVELGTATVNTDGTWSLSIEPTHYSTLHHWLYVYPHSSITGQTGAPAQQDFYIQDNGC